MMENENIFCMEVLTYSVQYRFQNEKNNNNTFNEIQVWNFVSG